MILKSPSLAHVLIIRPGSTEFDDQQRIKGSLDMPLSVHGEQQVDRMARELADVHIDVVYCAPDESARQSAQRLAKGRETRVKVVDAFRNVDHGLWHGKLIDEVRRNHPRIYRQGIDSPEDVCPPEGEPIHEARERVTKSLKKCLRRHRDRVIAIVAADPMAAVLDSLISGKELHDLWASELDDGSWNLIDRQQ
ncbi:histidine phosphatase family protein [Planctomycetes bacterium K23_9]|uniref:Phosphoserine phosphatase 1 n=1 Tax=Stieleria marina TaxID=1930275 RepID=A0A517NPY2_9BACT|nr:Phosphoserine phosphatase 1 [Planctomycetes bacterium K23_9]